MSKDKSRKLSEINVNLAAGVRHEEGGYSSVLRRWVRANGSDLTESDKALLATLPSAWENMLISHNNHDRPKDRNK